MEYEKRDPSFCFAAAGWMKVWYYGVGKAFQERVDLTGVNFAGSSAGSLVSLCLLAGVNFDELMDFTIGCVERCRTELKGPFKLRQFINECFDELYKESYLPLVQDRLNVFVTDLPICKPRRISKFRTHEELKFWVANSCNMPMFVGWPERADHYLQDEKFVWVFDGGATKFCPVLDEGSITISVFGKADIRPSKTIPLQHGLYPPPPGVMREYFAMGYRDANVWLSNAAYSSSMAASMAASSLFGSSSCSPPSSPSFSPPSFPPSFPSNNPPPSSSTLSAFTSLPSLSHFPSLSSLPPLSSLASLPAISFSSAPPLTPPTRHKLRIGKELIPPPMERRRDFLLPQVARSLWEITLLLFSFWVLFPFLFICTGVEKVLGFFYANVMLGVSFVAHVALLFQSKTLSSHVSHHLRNSKQNLFELFDPRLFLGYLFPAISRHIGTRHLDHEEFANMSFVYRYLQDTWLLRGYKGYRKEGREEREEEKVEKEEEKVEKEEEKEEDKEEKEEEQEKKEEGETREGEGPSPCFTPSLDSIPVSNVSVPLVAAS